jgi:small subunit ribosomal protein S6
MREYDIMLILDPEAEESVVQAVIDRITGVISRGGGQVAELDRWGKRRLAYQINKLAEGYYLVVRCTAEPEAVAELERTLTLADDVVRFKVVRRAA